MSEPIEERTSEKVICSEQACNTRQLIERVTERDEQAFLALYDCYAARVHAVTLHVLGDTMLAEEATQDTFMKVWKRAGLYRSDHGSFLVWLLTIARRTALDRVRQEGRRPVLSTSKDPEEIWPRLQDDSLDPEEARWRSLRFAVDSLPHNQQVVLELAYYQGLSQSQIAAHLGWPLGTVKTRLRTAMQALRHEWAMGEAV